MMWVSGRWSSPACCVAPEALKYRKATAVQWYAVAYHCKTRSNMSLVSPYELIGVFGCSSVIGTDSGEPYTAADDEKTNRLTGNSRRISSMAMPDATFVSKNTPGFETDSGINAFAAKWKTASISVRPSRVPNSVRSPKSVCYKIAPSGTAD